MNTIEQKIYKVDNLNILDCSMLCFDEEESGFMTLQYEDKAYKKVSLTRLVPFVSKTEYISVTYETDEKEFREIGVIKSIDELSDEQRKIVFSFLEFKYYMPEITKIHSLKDNMREFIFIAADTTSGKKTLCIRDWTANFKMLTKQTLYVVDADGNKYFAPDINKLDKKSLSIIEMYI